MFSLHGADAEVSCHLQPPHPWQPPMETPCKNMAAEGAGAAGRAPACLCVFCGLPAAGKSTLARKVLRTAAQCGWRAGVVPYDDLIPERAFQTGVAEGGGKLREMVKTRSILVATQKKSAIISPPSIGRTFAPDQAASSASVCPGVGSRRPVSSPPTAPH